MSTTETTPVELAPAFELNGLPVFLFSDNQFDQVEAQGHNHYYVLAGGKEKRPKASTTTSSTPQFEDVDIVKLYRITKSILGRAIVETTPANAGIKFATGQNMIPNLPLIPFKLINTMDAFFRAVHKEHKTEAILMLVYNTDFLGTENPAEGWGIIAPKQKNTPAFCDYDPTSVVDDLPDNVMLIGSAHSHPEMDAYASGTDHKDQADWDGIHITYGWKSHVKGGATEYYVETQYAGKKWAFPLEQLAEMAPKPVVPKEDIDHLLANVTKGTHTVTHGGTYSGPKTSGGTTPIPSFRSGHTGATSNAVLSHRAATKLPQGAPDPAKHVIIGVVANDENAACPFCGSSLHTAEFERHRCFACFNFITDAVDTDADYNADRERVSAKYIPVLDRKNSQVPIVLWVVADGIFTEDTRLSPKK